MSEEADKIQELCKKEVTITKEKLISEDRDLRKYIDTTANTTKNNCDDLIYGRNGTPKIRFSYTPGIGTTTYVARMDDEGNEKKTAIGNAKDFFYGRNKFDLKDYVKKKALVKKAEYEEKVRLEEEEEEERIRQEEEVYERMRQARQEKENRQRQNMAAYAARTNRIYGGRKTRRKKNPRKTRK